MRRRISRMFWIVPFGLLWACNVEPATIPPTETLPPPTETLTDVPASLTPTKSRTLTLANTPSKTDGRTRTPASTESPASTATEARDVEVKLGVVEFDIPAGLADSGSLTTTTREELPYINPSAGPMPEHWVIALNGYSLREAEITPEIIIFHTDEFAQFSNMTRWFILSLRELQSQPDLPVESDLHISRFCSQIYKLRSSRGFGVRYLTQIFMAYNPVNNDDIFYYYQGLSADGGYYFSAKMPLLAPFLSADSGSSTALPAGGIPFPENVDDKSFGDYLAAVSAKINASRPDVFQPSLILLDALMRSIRIKG